MSADYIPTRALAPILQSWRRRGGQPHVELTPAQARLFHRILTHTYETVRHDIADRLLIAIDEPWHLTHLPVVQPAPQPARVYQTEQERQEARRRTWRESKRRRQKLRGAA